MNDSKSEIESPRKTDGEPVPESPEDPRLEHTFKSIAAREPAASDLLCLMTFLAAQPVPIDALLKGKAVLPTRLRETFSSGESARKVLSLLQEEGVGLVDDETFQVPISVQNQIKERLNDAQGASWAAAAVSFILHLFPVQLRYDQPVPECDALLDHALTAIGHARESKIRPGQVGDLANLIGLYLHGCGEDEQAKECFQHSIELTEEALGPADPKLATRWNNLGVVHQDLNDLEEARICFANAVNLVLAQAGQRDEAVVQPLRNLYLALVLLEEWEAAREAAENALRVFLEIYELSHAHVSECLSLLGKICHQLKDVEAAKKHFDKAVLSVSYAQPYSAHDVAVCKRNFGHMLLEFNEFKEAEEEFRAALELNRSVFGDKHMSVPLDLAELGQALRGQEKCGEAETCFKEALAICQLIEGGRTLSQVPILKNMADMFAETGNHRGVCICLARELTLNEAKFGKGAPELARGLIRLGRAFEKRAKYDDAKGCFDRALRIHKEHRNLTPDDEARAHQYLGRVYLATHEAGQALVHIEAGLRIREQAHGPTDSKVAKDNLELGRLLIESGQRLKGLAHFSAGLRAYESRLGKNHPKTLKIQEEYQRRKKRPNA